MEVGPDGGPLIFYISRSKVKGQGQISMKICLFQADFGHRGCVWDYSGPGRVRWGTIGSMPTNFGNLPKVVERQGRPLWKGFPVLASSQCGWQGAKFEKSPSPKHRAIARCEVFLSIGSDRPPWAAGEYEITYALIGEQFWGAKQFRRSDFFQPRKGDSG